MAGIYNRETLARAFQCRLIMSPVVTQTNRPENERLSDYSEASRGMGYCVASHLPPRKEHEQNDDYPGNHYHEGERVEADCVTKHPGIITLAGFQKERLRGGRKLVFHFLRVCYYPAG